MNIYILLDLKEKIRFESKANILNHKKLFCEANQAL